MIYMSLVTQTFKLEEYLVKKLDREPTQNHLWNTKSELLRALVKLYFTDPRVKAAVDRAVILRYPHHGDD